MQPVHAVLSGQQARKAGRVVGKPGIQCGQGVQPGGQVLRQPGHQKALVHHQTSGQQVAHGVDGRGMGRAAGPDGVDGQILRLVQRQQVPAHLHFIQQTQKAFRIRPLWHQHVDVRLTHRLNRRAGKLPAGGAGPWVQQPAGRRLHLDVQPLIGQQRGDGLDHPLRHGGIHRPLWGGVQHHPVRGQPEGDGLQQPAGRCGRGWRVCRCLRGCWRRRGTVRRDGSLRCGEGAHGRSGTSRDRRRPQRRMLAQPAVMGPVAVGRCAQGQRPQAQPSFGQGLADAGQPVVQQAASQPVGGQQGAGQQAKPRVFNGCSLLDTTRCRGGGGQCGVHAAIVGASLVGLMRAPRPGRGARVHKRQLWQTASPGVLSDWGRSDCLSRSSRQPPFHSGVSPVAFTL